MEKIAWSPTTPLLSLAGSPSGNAAANCLLATIDKYRVLFNAGAGNFGENEDNRLDNSLLEIGLTPDDIDIVVLSHLQWDRAGGILSPDQSEIIFPRARFFIGASAFNLAKKEGDANGFSSRIVNALEKKDHVLLLSEPTTPLLQGVEFLFTVKPVPHEMHAVIPTAGGGVLFGRDLYGDRPWDLLTPADRQETDALLTTIRTGRRNHWFHFYQDPSHVAVLENPESEVDDEAVPFIHFQKTIDWPSSVAFAQGTYPIVAHTGTFAAFNFGIVLTNSPESADFLEKIERLETANPNVEFETVLGKAYQTPSTAIIRRNDGTRLVHAGGHRVYHLSLRKKTIDQISSDPSEIREVPEIFQLKELAEGDYLVMISEGVFFDYDQLTHEQTILDLVLGKTPAEAVANLKAKAGKASVAVLRV
jgi:glyoxylase-like metal-dependent hydrolase (beta-lactamase superfamily II)